jgi:hypothetical protein
VTPSDVSVLLLCLRCCGAVSGVMAEQGGFVQELSSNYDPWSWRRRRAVEDGDPNHRPCPTGECLGSTGGWRWPFVLVCAGFSLQSFKDSCLSTVYLVVSVRNFCNIYLQ